MATYMPAKLRWRNRHFAIRETSRPQIVRELGPCMVPKEYCDPVAAAAETTS
jgi:hypothetical protein